MSTYGLSKSYTVVGLGELLWDLLPEGRQLGGAPANFAYHARLLCGSGIPVSCVGADELGTEAVALLGLNGLSSDYISVDQDHPTGVVSVSLDKAGVPDYRIHEEVAWDFLPETPVLAELAQATDAVCFGSLAQRSPVTRGTIYAFLRATRPDCLKVFDVNLRQSFYDVDVLRASLELADVVKLSDDELPVLRGMLELAEEDSEALAQLLDKFSIQVIALTLGARGAVMANPEVQVHEEGIPPEHLADTVGAGDAFTASMTVGLLHRHPLAKICSDANRYASYVCSQRGAMPHMPDRAFIQSIVGD